MFKNPIDNNLIIEEEIKEVFSKDIANHIKDTINPVLEKLFSKPKRVEK